MGCQPKSHLYQSFIYAILITARFVYLRNLHLQINNIRSEMTKHNVLRLQSRCNLWCPLTDSFPLDSEQPYVHPIRSLSTSTNMLNVLENFLCPVQRWLRDIHLRCVCRLVGCQVKGEVENTNRTVSRESSSYSVTHDDTVSYSYTSCHSCWSYWLYYCCRSNSVWIQHRPVSACYNFKACDSHDSERILWLFYKASNKTEQCEILNWTVWQNVCHLITCLTPQ